VKIIINNEITIENPTSELIEYVREKFTLKNPEFEKRQRLGLSMWGVKKHIQYYKLEDNLLIIPFGLFSYIEKFIERDKVIYDHKPIEAPKKNSNTSPPYELKLFDFQEKALKEMLDKKSGIVVATAGSGKTETAIGYIIKMREKNNIKVLWVSHTKDLITQAEQRLRKYASLDIGFITDGKMDINDKDVVFATIQSLEKFLPQIQNHFDLLILDECHHFTSKGVSKKKQMFERVIGSMNTRFRIGLTATNFRADSYDFGIISLISPVICEINNQQNIVKASVRFVNTDFNLNNIPRECLNYDGTMNYSGVITALVENQKRSSVIIDQIKQKLKDGENKIIVLSDRVNHLEYLQQKVGEGVLFTGSCKRKEREDILERINKNNDIKIIFATYKIFSEGISINSLNTMVLATPIKFNGKLIQAIGRIERRDENNKEKKPEIIDVVDPYIKMFKSMSFERRLVYKQNGNKIH
jgi:superfamily II DNA or RNA helicase